MRHIFAILLAILISLETAGAPKTDYNFVGRPVTEALAEFCRRNPELHVNFIYDELQDYKVKERVRSGDPLEVLKSIVALNPVSVTYDDGRIFIEAMQKGKYRYAGRTVDRISGEPVSFATVLILNPKDSTIITYGITDEKGAFSIPCDRKNVLARVSSVGYKTSYFPSPSFSMGKVMMDAYSVKLKELTATPDSRYVMSDRVAYVPTVREKKAAGDGINLLRFMAIPSLRVNPTDDAVSTLSGGEVALFIDNVRASAQEIQGMRPEDVKRVEILDYPADPRFEGVAHAVNFIMVKYEYGGYTKLSARQQVEIPDYGYYSLSSKFVKGKLTYDLFTGYDRYHSSHEKNEGVAVYDFNGEEVEWLRKMPEAKIENDETYISGRIKYASDKTMLSNQFSLRYDDVPKSHVIQENTYIPAIYPQGADEQSHRRSSLTPSWSGNWQFSLPNQLQLVVTPSAKYSHNSSKTLFSESGIENVSNVREDAWGANLGAGLSKAWGQHSLTVTINGELGDDRLHYTGTNPADVHYSNQAVGARLRGNFTFGKFRLQPSVGYYFQWSAFDKEHYTQSLPSYYISGGINFNPKHQLSFSTEMSNWTIGVSYRSPNVVVKNLLDAVKGNPKLKAWLYNDVQFDYTWIPLQKFYLSAFAGYTRHTRPMDFSYNPAEINGREMMLRTYVKEGYFQYFSEGFSATLRLFDNSLSIKGEGRVKSYRKGGLPSPVSSTPLPGSVQGSSMPFTHSVEGSSMPFTHSVEGSSMPFSGSVEGSSMPFTHSVEGGPRPFSRTVINGSLSASWYFGNFYLRAYFEFAQRDANQYERIYDQPCYYTLTAGWGAKGWKISAQLNNPFRSDFKKLWTVMDYGNYRSETDYFGTAYRRNLWINVSYTFNYGKRLREENIGKGLSPSSGIVR